MKLRTTYFCCQALVLLFLLNSCASTKITGEWRNPEYGGEKFSHILVVGVAKQPDSRKFYEDEFAKHLNRLGIMAIASHTIIPRDKMHDKDIIAQSIAGLNIDGVIMTRLQGISEKHQLSYGETYHVPYAYYDNMYDYYNTSFSTAPSQSYAETHEYLQLETNLYDADSEKLVYSLTTNTFFRQKYEGRLIAYIETVVRQLRENGLL